MMRARICQLTAAVVVVSSGCAALPPVVTTAEPTESFPVTWEGEVASEMVALAEAQATGGADEEAFAAAVGADTFESYLAYLEQHPEGAHCDDALNRAKAHADAVGDADLTEIAYGKLITATPDFLALLPPDKAVLYIGPPGMRIKDILEMLGKGLEADVISSKISAGAYEYKDFSLKELSAMKTLGIPGPVVKAMIESHANAEKARKEKEEKDALRREIAELRELITAQQTSGGAAGSGGGGEMIQTEKGPMDKAACMAARLGAMKLCEQIPWPGSTACVQAAKAGFPCND